MYLRQNFNRHKDEEDVEDLLHMLRYMYGNIKYLVLYGDISYQ